MKTRISSRIYTPPHGGIVFAEDAVLSEPVPENRASFMWLAKRRFRSGQTHGRVLAEKSPVLAAWFRSSRLAQRYFIAASLPR